MSLCDATASKNDLFAQPQALNFRKQSDSFDVPAKHCTSEVYIKNHGNPITLDSSEYCNVFSAKCLDTHRQANIGLILDMVKAKILPYILSL